MEMGEFGEQLRKAREAKGMTQQTLAEHLYVTRQAVSRWECGDRYPDLIMAKKLAAFLEVSLDDLVSTDEMKKVAERNQIIEMPFMKHVLIILYACISLSFLFTAVDIIMRFPITSTDYSFRLLFSLMVSYWRCKELLLQRKPECQWRFILFPYV